MECEDCEEYEEDCTCVRLIHAGWDTRGEANGDR